MSTSPRSHRPHRNGWTPDRQAAFIVALASHQSVTAAAAIAGMSRESAYWLRRQPAAAAFRAQWDAAVAGEVKEADVDALGAAAPENWSTRRLIRWLERMGDRDLRADPAKA